MSEANAAAPAKPTASLYRFYVLFLLTGVYTFNFVDRQIIGILSPAIKADLGLADWQLGILKGFAFAVLYTTLGIPIARLADRHNRVSIISIALALWSGFTALSGMAANFTQLALARVGVGIGEAGGSPPAHSLISDYFPKEKRAGALAIYAMGIPIGMALAFLGGGWLTQTFSWRVAFVVVGLPGILMALLLKFTVKEPERGQFDGDEKSDQFKRMEIGEPQGSFEKFLRNCFVILPSKARAGTFNEVAMIWRAAKFLFAIPTYRAVVIATTAISFTAYANGAWIVDFYTRAHSDFPLMQIYLWLGIVSGTAYAAGTFLGGFLVDKFAIKDRKMYGYIPAIALALNVPAFMFVLWHPNPVVSLAFQFPVQLAIGFYLGPAFALAQTLAPVSVRALSTAVFFFVLNMIALGLGPTIAGFLSSALIAPFGEDLGLRIALSVVSLAGLYGAWMFLQVSNRIDADWNAATGDGQPH
ncbi:spinster family MFS transporter [Hyphococcus lacteus]|uniref:MFS transporter n=1 Tax=Hyphococcus lacteus TaxID=3143536 RepID=A0ABV3Z564_9PROT